MPLPPKGRVMLDEGDVVEIVCAGGGGFGPPHDRDPALIQEDLRQGYVISAVFRSGDEARLKNYDSVLMSEAHSLILF